jgi:hypothetical protein
MSGYPEPIHFLNLSSWLAHALGVSEAIGELFACLFIVGIFVVITIALRSQLIVVITGGFMVMMGLTAIGWIPYYVWILIAVYVAIMFARNYRSLF